MNYMAIVWFVLLLIFGAAEAATPTLVSIWFAGGSLAAMIVSLLGGEIWLQAVVFVTVSAVLLISVRPMTKKYLKPTLVKTNVDAVVGSRGLVTEPVDNITAQGQVKLGAMEWSARSTDGNPIEQGTLVQVDRVEGVKVFVTEVK